MLENYYLASFCIGLLLVIENWSLFENQGRFKGASILISLLEFIWLFVTLYVIFFSDFSATYLVIPIAFILYNIAGWIAAHRYIDMPELNDYNQIDDEELDTKKLEELDDQMKQDLEAFKNTQIPRKILVPMLYFTVLYTLANLYVVIKLWLS